MQDEKALVGEPGERNREEVELETVMDEAMEAYTRMMSQPLLSKP